MNGATNIGIPPTGYRLPVTTRLGPVHLQVSDLVRSLEWYERVLGLRVAERRNGTATLTDQAGTATLTDQAGATTLVKLRERAGARPARRRLGLYHFAILLPERAALGAFLRHLRTQGEAVAASDHLVSEALYLDDPDGLGIEVYADRPRATWQASNREIVMATGPLDESGLARAALNTAWNGVPTGTTIGHVHLHVGDLAQAASFYAEGLGFDRVAWNYPGALFLSAGGYHHHLGVNVWAGNAEPANDDEARLLDWSLVLPTLDDVRATAASLEAAGYAAQEVGGGVVTADPWGTNLRILADG
ncbi:MAG: VOC family protein [Truepera sp.]|nr:VOC family protein [Truepera sp.]